MSLINYPIKKNDLVKVIAGKDRGKTGKVLRVLRKEARALVERVNIVKKHVKPSQQNRLGGIVEKEAPIHISNLMVIDPQTHKATRVGHKFVEADGGAKKKVRISVKSGEILDKL